MTSETPTRLDQLLRRVKNHRVLVWVLFLFIVVVGIGQISEAIVRIHGFLAKKSPRSAPAPAPAPMNLAREKLRKAGIEFTAKSLIEAARIGDSERARLLLEAGVNPDSKAKEFPGTALGYASSRGYVEVASLLLTSGANVNATSVGLTPLMLAAYYGEDEIVQLLLVHAATVDARGLDSSTALMLAAQGCQRFTAETLLEAGADPNLRNENGFTSLMFAVEGCREKQFELKSLLILLAKNGADLKARDNEGDTVLDVAKNNRLDDIVRLVEDLSVLQSNS